MGESLGQARFALRTSLPSPLGTIERIQPHVADAEREPHSKIKRRRVQVLLKFISRYLSMV